MKHDVCLLSFIIRFFVVSFALLMAAATNAEPQRKLANILARHKNAHRIIVYAIPERILFNNAVLPGNVKKFAELEFTFVAGSQEWNDFWKVAEDTIIAGQTGPGDFRWALFAEGVSRQQIQMLAIDRTARVTFIDGQYSSAHGSLFRWLKSLALHPRTTRK